ncbi:MAG: hypothetical protein MJ033_00415 [Victivallaceae bacterium]|nr:hypothetical protein [Victivallaceae bacterium]
MSWLTQNIEKECCLTCQHFKVGRRLKVMGRNLFIEYDSVLGACKLFNNFPKGIECRPMTGSFCRYKKWVELP